MDIGLQRYHESFRDSFARQTQWVEKRGVLLIIAMYSGVIGSATYVLGVGLHAPVALLIGWGLGVVGKSGFHLAFLGRPERFWRALRRPQSSWLSRGIWALAIFSVLGALYAGPYVLHSSSPPSSGPLYWIVLVLASFLLVHDGFLVRAATGVRVWAQWTLPVLFPVFGLLAGSAILTILRWLGSLPSSQERVLEHLLQGFLVAGAAFLTLSLLLAVRRSGAARASVIQLTGGYVWGWFWLGAVLLAVALPAISVALDQVTAVPITVLGSVAILSIVGEFGFKYSVLASGIYAPLYPASAEAAALSKMAAWQSG